MKFVKLGNDRIINFDRVCWITRYDDDCWVLHFTDGRNLEVESDVLMGVLDDLCGTSSTSTGTPKLTVDVFSSQDCPNWAKYAAVDNDGTAYFYEHKPKRQAESWVPGPGDFTGMSDAFDSSNWENSLIKRPAR